MTDRELETSFAEWDWDLPIASPPVALLDFDFPLTFPEAEFVMDGWKVW